MVRARQFLSQDGDVDDRLLRIYDEQLRTEAETPGAASVTRVGPLRLATYLGGRGFVTYRSLDGADLGQLVEKTREHYERDPGIAKVEWKTRGHDHAPGLHEALEAGGFEKQETESIMMGVARMLAADVPLPPGVSLRRISAEADVRAMTAMQDVAFGDPVRPHAADALLARDDDMELWVAEADGTMVSAGRLEPVHGSEVAGIWGGATLKEWRGRGIYRALTSVRARRAMERGRTLIHSDSTEYSRPILERAGLVKVSTTTPYLWKRDRDLATPGTRTASGSPAG